MDFNSKTGHEIRTWILFFVGIALAIIFAIKETPLNPWWTLIIGAFTSTAIIVSAVQAAAGGMTNAAKKVLEDAKRELENETRNGGFEPSDTSGMGRTSNPPLRHFYIRHASAV